MAKWKQFAYDIADVIDAYRVIPRIILMGYGVLIYNMYQWFTLLDNPNTQQAAFVSTIIGAFSAVAGLYFKSGRDKNGGEE